jgi:hypothetical protein
MKKIILFAVAVGFTLSLAKAQTCLSEQQSGLMGNYYYLWQEVMCANTPASFGVTPNEWCDIDINNGPNTAIAVKITVNHLPQNASLAVNINNRWEVIDWQDGQTYLFQTLDNSGACMIELIGEPADEFTGGMGSITVSYQVLDQYRIYGLNVDDQMAYYNTIIVSRKAKYIGRPMSVLIQDMDAYDVWVVEYLLDRHKDFYGLYDGIEFYFDDLDNVLDLKHGKKYFRLFVEFSGYYDGRLIDDVNESGYTNAHKAVFSNNLVMDIRLEALN